MNSEWDYYHHQNPEDIFLKKNYLIQNKVKIYFILLFYCFTLIRYQYQLWFFKCLIFNSLQVNTAMKFKNLPFTVFIFLYFYHFFTVALNWILLSFVLFSTTCRLTINLLNSNCIYFLFLVFLFTPNIKNVFI